MKPLCVCVYFFCSFFSLFEIVEGCRQGRMTWPTNLNANVPATTTKKTTANTSLQHFTTTLLHNTSIQHLLQYFSITLPYNTYSSTTLYYKVLLQYYFDRNDVRTTSIQYYSVLQSTTPVLLRTTKYYSSTTPYYKGTTKYDSVLQSTTPVLLRSTK